MRHKMDLIQILSGNTYRAHSPVSACERPLEVLGHVCCGVKALD